MGYYIQALHTHGKAAYLISEHGASKLPDCPPWSDDYAIVCVVDNGLFEAAALAYSPGELEVFCQNDGRAKVFLRMDKAVAHRLAGYNKQ